MADDSAEQGAGQIVFEGDDLRVRDRPAAGSRDVVVTFTGRSSKPPVPKGFGEDFLAKRGIAAVHFISKANHWWQTAETDAAVDQVKRDIVADRFDRVTLYGSSMGGFASLIQSNRLQADHAIVISPQYSIDGEVVPFEKRWRNYAAKLTFDWDDMPAGLNPATKISAVIDPLFRPDMEHIRLVEKLHPVDRIAIPFAGHNTARVLEEIALMQPTLEALLADRFDLPAFRRAYRERRTGASLFWFGLAEALIVRRRDAWAAGPAQIAAQMIANGARMRDAALRGEILRLAANLALDRGDRDAAAQWMAVLGDADAEAGDSAAAQLIAVRIALAGRDHATALALLKRYRTERPRDSEAIALLLATLRAEGETDRATRFADKVAEPQRRDVAVQREVARIRLAAGQTEEARRALQAAQRQDGADPAIRVALAQHLFDLDKKENARRQLAPVIAGTLVSMPDRETVYALARRLGWKREAERFRRRCARADQLYRLIRDTLSTIATDDPRASMPAFVAHVAARRAGQG